MALTGIDPRGVIEGARLWLRGDGLPAPASRDSSISIGGVAARVVFASPDRVAVLVPPAATPGRAPVRASWAPGATLFVDIGVRLATGLHQVDSPAIGADGGIYAAFSGSRGQESAVSVYRVTPDGGREAFVEGIVNATSLAVSPEGVLHVSSRYDGTVYRVSAEGRPEPMVSELGVACGLAFAPDGTLFVGDRSGSIHRVSQGGARVEAFATLPPSVAAFHLAMGPDEMLYVTAPTLATRDAVHRFDASGRHETWRPRSAGHRAWRSIRTACCTWSKRWPAPPPSTGSTPAGRRRPVVSGPGLIGVAFAADGTLIAATADSLFAFPASP